MTTRRDFLKLMGLGGAAVVTGTAGRALASLDDIRLERERQDLMQHVRDCYQQFDLRGLYNQIKQEIPEGTLPPEITEIAEKLAKGMNGNLNGVDLARQIGKEVEEIDLIELTKEIGVVDSLKYKQRIERFVDGKIHEYLTLLTGLVPEDQRQDDDSEQLYRERLREFRDGLVREQFGVRLDDLREHVAKYQESDLAIVYLPMGNLPEALQAYISEPFIKYIELTFGKKATVFWPKLNENGIPECVEALTDPKYSDVAIIGHGSWSAVSLNGVAEDPEDVLLKLIKAYNEDPEETADTLASFSFEGFFNEFRGYIEQKETSMVLNKEGEEASLGIPKRKPGKLVKYTCGVNRYESDTLPEPSPELESMMDVTKIGDIMGGHGIGIEKRIFFSAENPRVNGVYEKILIEELKKQPPSLSDYSGPSERREVRDDLEGSDNYWCERFQEESKDCSRSMREVRIRSNLRRATKEDLVAAYNVQEAPLFGISLMQDPSKIFAYEGIAWVDDYMRDAMPEIKHELVGK